MSNNLPASVELISGRTEIGLCEAGARAGVPLGSLASEKHGEPSKAFFPLCVYPVWGERVGQFPCTWPLGREHSSSANGYGHCWWEALCRKCWVWVLISVPRVNEFWGVVEWLASLFCL